MSRQDTQSTPLAPSSPSSPSCPSYFSCPCKQRGHRGAGVSCAHVHASLSTAGTRQLKEQARRVWSPRARPAKNLPAALTSCSSSCRHFLFLVRLRGLRARMRRACPPLTGKASCLALFRMGQSRRAGMAGKVAAGSKINRQPRTQQAKADAAVRGVAHRAWTSPLSLSRRRRRPSP